MPHAFRSAALIEAEAAQKKLDRLRERWASTRESWFDGTPHSVDRRIAWLDEVISTASGAASRLHASKVGADAMVLLPQLRADREALVARRDRLAGWYSGPEDHGFNLDPRDYASREEWMDASNLSGYLGDSVDKHGPVRHRHEDMGFSPQDITRLKGLQAAREFVEEQNTTDRQELLVRAQRAVEARTAGWTLSGSNAAVREFLEAVDSVIPRQVRQASRAVGTETVQDFDDALMFG